MILNKFEFVSMNNPIRAFIQEFVEIQELRKLSNLPKGMKVLEIGCGNGWGTKLIMKYFVPKEIQAIDLDPKMIAIANRGNRLSNITFSTGDVSKLEFKDNTFDAVFDFGIIHHIPNWKMCIDELKRVLKPNGQVILEDLSIETFEIGLGKLLRKVLAHPYGSMFKRSELVDYLKSQGFKVEKYRVRYPLNFLQYFVLTAHK